MKRLRRKLHSQSGASILLALLLLLVCVLVAASILAAAASNVGKARSNRVEQQKYLTLSSAIRLVADEIQQAKYTGRYKVYTWTVPHTEGEGENAITYYTYHFHIQQEQGDFTCGDLADSTEPLSSEVLPLRDELNEIFSRQFIGKGDGYSKGDSVDVEAPASPAVTIPRTLIVTLPDGLEGYPDSGFPAYQVSKEVTVQVELNHATRHIMLTAWLGDGAKPADGSDTMIAELVAIEETVSKIKDADIPAGIEPTALPNPLPEGAAVTERTLDDTPMKWELNWIKKGVP